ncbi:class I tRNA ligase family protein, partial [bacterium]|nr:class I tRNA ligase family protein [bacterium]
FAGLHVFDADPKIVEHLREIGALLHTEAITHSYPHCWRSKKPVIFRATEQWFVSVDHKNLRQRMLDAIQGVNWIPDWGKGRITAMVSDRPDWCISRQRSWGIPIPAFYCTACGAALMTKDTLLAVADLFGERGSDAWFHVDPADILPQGTACSECGAGDFRKESDILDVWFESGSSHRSVLKTYEELQWPADLYLEGTDQHRGWFQLSLLPAIAADGAAPFREVLTHGFVVSESGEKMSKSLGNYISVADALEEFGAEMQRLWSASVDYRDDIKVDRKVLERLNEPYRRYRNTFRYLLGNLSDFDPAEDAVDLADLREIDRLMLSRTQRLIADVRTSYAEHQFYRVFQRTYSFCTVDLSSFYLDVIKDRLYCEGADSAARRSVQTVMDVILNALVRLLAPILVHTCEDVWDAMPHREDLPTVHLALFPEPKMEWVDAALEAKWERLLAVRDEAARELEKLRAAKTIGSGLDARVTLYAEGDLHAFLTANAALLPVAFICSEVDVVEGASDAAIPATAVEGLAVAVRPSERAKCGRCWRLLPCVGAQEDHPELCGRCATVVRALPDPEGDEA